MSFPLFVATRDDEGLLALPGGERCETLDAPIGAMWACECHRGQGWMIRLPGGRKQPIEGTTFEFPNLWCTLMVTGDGKGWDVSGEAPALTVSPSILVHGEAGCHVVITNGVINEV